jgi:hypothetical protein
MKRLFVSIVSFAVTWMFALCLPGDSASAVLPQLDHDAVLAAIPGVVEAGAPSFVVHAVDEYGEWSAAAGVEDVKTGVPASPDGAFRIGSITKPMMAVAVLQLVDEGVLDLDVPVDTYLPGKPTFWSPDLEYGLGIMPLHGCVELLGHTGAIFGYQAEVWMTLDQVRTVTAAVPVYAGSEAIWNAAGNMWSHELCPPISSESNRSTGTWHAPIPAHFD